MIGPRSILVLLVALAGCNGLSLRKADGSSLGESVRSALHLQTPGPFAHKYLEQRGLEPGIGFDPVTTAAKLTDQASPEGHLVLAELCDLAGREAPSCHQDRGASTIHTPTRFPPRPPPVLPRHSWRRSR